MLHQAVSFKVPCHNFSVKRRSQPFEGPHYLWKSFWIKTYVTHVIYTISLYLFSGPVVYITVPRRSSCENQKIPTLSRTNSLQTHEVTAKHLYRLIFPLLSYYSPNLRLPQPICWAATNPSSHRTWLLFWTWSPRPIYTSGIVAVQPIQCIRQIMAVLTGT